MKDDPLVLSPRAVARRLDEMRALSDLMNYLAKFRPAVEAAELEAKQKRG